MASLIADLHCAGVCDHSSCLLSALRGFRNGLLYGAKVRFPHAVVMTFLFGWHKSFPDKMRAIWRATTTHSKNLGVFAGLFKLALCTMRHIRQRESPINHAVAGFLVGMYCWGTQNSINSQVNMYILSRITLGLARTAVAHGIVPAPSWSYPVYAGAIWAAVMTLFAFERDQLQGSLVASMDYLYLDSNKWPASAKNVFDWFYRYQ